jgi:hypothetical protein
MGRPCKLLPPPTSLLDILSPYFQPLGWLKEMIFDSFLDLVSVFRASSARRVFGIPIGPALASPSAHTVCSSDRPPYTEPSTHAGNGETVTRCLVQSAENWAKFEDRNWSRSNLIWGRRIDNQDGRVAGCLSVRPEGNPISVIEDSDDIAERLSLQDLL